MAAVAFIAIATTALRSASHHWASVTFTLALGGLATAVLYAICGGRQHRPFWLGFALFGWGYMTLAFAPWFSEHVQSRLPTTNAIDHLFHRANPGVGTITNVMGALPPVHTYIRRDPARPGQVVFVNPEDVQETGHSLFALLAALIGGIVARGLDAFRPRGPGGSAHHGTRSCLRARCACNGPEIVRRVSELGRWKP